MDDIILMSNTPSMLSNVIGKLSTRFSLKDLGTLSYFLGVEVHKHHGGLILNQQRYILDLLAKFNTADANSVSTPMFTTTILAKASCEVLSSPIDYRIIIVILQYVSLTRPDVGFTINKIDIIHAQSYIDPLECPKTLRAPVLNELLSNEAALFLFMDFQM